MTIVVISLVLAQLILIPLAYKWELNLKVVSISALIIGLFVGLVISIVEKYFFMGLPLKLISCSVLIVSISLSALLVRFFRDPDRVPPQRHNIILSPADGLIKYIKHIEKNEVSISSKGRENVKLSAPLTDIFENGQGYLIGIGMTFLDVHVTRSPIKGKLTYFKHIPGSFCSLKKEDAPYKNERVIEIVENEKSKVGFIQIASRLVRRIVSYVREGDELALGQKVGMIKFGSQVDIVLPDLKDLRIKVKVGEQVYAGLSIIAEF
jgi:phosphatidylserine decarboxylase